MTPPPSIAETPSARPNPFQRPVTSAPPLRTKTLLWPSVRLTNVPSPERLIKCTKTCSTPMKVHLCTPPAAMWCWWVSEGYFTAAEWRLIRPWLGPILLFRSNSIALCCVAQVAQALLLMSCRKCSVHFFCPKYLQSRLNDWSFGVFRLCVLWLRRKWFTKAANSSIRDRMNLGLEPIKRAWGPGNGHAYLVPKINHPCQTDGPWNPTLYTRPSLSSAAAVCLNQRCLNDY